MQKFVATLFFLLLGVASYSQKQSHADKYYFGFQANGIVNVFAPYEKNGYPYDGADTSPWFSGEAGIFYSFELSETNGLEVGLFYARRNAKAESSSRFVTSNTRFVKAIQVPIKMNFYIGRKWIPYVGVNINFFLDGPYAIPANDPINSSLFSEFTLGTKFMVSEHWGLNSQLALGFTPVYEQSIEAIPPGSTVGKTYQVKSSTRYFAFGVFYRL